MCLCCGRSVARAVYGHVISYGAPHARSLRARGAPLLKWRLRLQQHTHYGMALIEKRPRKTVGPLTICALTKGADPCRVL